jgi:hypothetical protein
MMRFAATCPLCKRTISALSMFMLGQLAEQHIERCAERAEQAAERKRAAQAQGSLF